MVVHSKPVPINSWRKIPRYSRMKTINSTRQLGTSPLEVQIPCQSFPVYQDPPFDQQFQFWPPVNHYLPPPQIPYYSGDIGYPPPHPMGYDSGMPSPPLNFCPSSLLGFAPSPPPGPPFQMPLAPHSPPLFDYQNGSCGIPYGSPPVSPTWENNGTPGSGYIFYPPSPPPQQVSAQYNWQQFCNLVAPVPMAVFPCPTDAANQAQFELENNQDWLQWKAAPRASPDQQWVIIPTPAAMQNDNVDSSPAFTDLNATTTAEKTVCRVNVLNGKAKTTKMSERPRTSSLPSALCTPASFCIFCKNNRETKKWYESHVLKTKNGATCCPILRKYTCPICSATGDKAHTLRYCPENPENHLNGRNRTMSLPGERSVLRNSRGIIGAYRYK